MKCISGISDGNGSIRQPKGEDERVRHAIFMELTNQQIALGPHKPLVSFLEPGCISVQVDVPKLLDAIKAELN